MKKMTGIDLCYIPKIERLMKRSKRFLKKCFTKREIKEFRERNFSARSIASAWTAKEAFAKALGLGIYEVGLLNISLLHNNKGRPFIEYTGDLNIRNIEVSISHEGDYSIAIVRLDKGLRNIETNKGDYGRLGIIAGSIGMAGAVMLSSMSALRSGVGLCYVISPNKILPILQSRLIEPVFIRTSAKDYFNEDSLEEVLEKISDLDALAIGPGMGRGEGVEKFIKGILKSDLPMVIDADGINAIGTKDLMRDAPTIITPHPKEFSRLIKREVIDIQSDRIGFAQRFAKETGAVIALKGNKTVVASKDELYINNTGNPGMATAGSGDVLTGIVATLLSQNHSPFQATMRAVKIHGLSGDLAMHKYGDTSLIARDLIEFLPKAIRSEYEI